MSENKTIYSLLKYRKEKTPEHVFGVYDNNPITFESLGNSIDRLSSGFLKLGMGPGKRIALMLKNHPDHIFSVFSISCIGAVWIPVNINLKGPGLAYILETSAPDCLIVEQDIWERQKNNIEKIGIKHVFIHRVNTREKGSEEKDFDQLYDDEIISAELQTNGSQLRCISFTSGTTGPPKGVNLTEKMLIACAKGAATASCVTPGDVYLLWEPIYHNSGVQMCILALLEPVKLIIASRFSASKFWSQIKDNKVTKLHYLGGIIDILLKLPPSDSDKSHNIKIAFGAGCRKENWRLFEKRFNVKIHEVYGLTEASGFTTLNRTGKLGAIGKPLPYFEVKLVNGSGRECKPGQTGEILIREKETGLVTKGYHENKEATRELFKDGWLQTGDLGYFDEDDDLFYAGRAKDCLRRRGENISAWEVETVLNMHPQVVESAVVGVQTQIGEQDIKAFLNIKPGCTVSPLEIIKWCETRMSYYQIPRFIEMVDSFPKTPTERIRKKELSLDVSHCWDFEKSSYQIHR